MVPWITRQTGAFIGSRGARAIEPLINPDAGRKGVMATIIYVAVLFFSASAVFVDLQDAMNTIWGVTPRPRGSLRRLVRTRLLSLGMIPGVAFLLVLTAFVLRIGSDVSGLVSVHWGAMGVNFLLPLALETVLFALIYKLVPDANIRWRDVWPGAGIGAALFTLGRVGLAIYFRHGIASSTYGPAASLVAVLIWVYYSSFSLFYGAEFTKVWARRKITPNLPRA